MYAINTLTLSHSSICISNSIRVNWTAPLLKKYNGKHRNPLTKKNTLTISIRLRALPFVQSTKRISKRAKKRESPTLKTSLKTKNRRKSKQHFAKVKFCSKELNSWHKSYPLNTLLSTRRNNKSRFSLSKRLSKAKGTCTDLLNKHRIAQALKNSSYKLVLKCGPFKAIKANCSNCEWWPLRQSIQSRLTI